MKMVLGLNNFSNCADLYHSHIAASSSAQARCAFFITIHARNLVIGLRMNYSNSYCYIITDYNIFHFESIG